MLGSSSSTSNTEIARNPLAPFGYGGVDPSAVLRLLEDESDIDCVAALSIWTHGARNANASFYRAGS